MMPTELFQLKSKKSITKLYLSDDWASTTPWRHNNLIQPYFSKVTEMSESETVLLTYRYIGPFGVLTGKWVEDDSE
jgi:hypothetical protein